MRLYGDDSLLAGSVRKGYKNQRLLIHNTRFCDFYIENATAEELEAKANDLRSEDNKILDFYVERTGLIGKFSPL